MKEKKISERDTKKKPTFLCKYGCSEDLQTRTTLTSNRLQIQVSVIIDGCQVREQWKIRPWPEMSYFKYLRAKI